MKILATVQPEAPTDLQGKMTNKLTSLKKDFSLMIFALRNRRKISNGVSLAKKARKASNRIKVDIVIIRDKILRLAVLYFTCLVDLIAYILEKIRQVITPANPAENPDHVV